MMVYKSRQFSVKHDSDLKYRPPERQNFGKGVCAVCKADRNNVEIMGEETGSSCKNLSLSPVLPPFYFSKFAEFSL